MADWARVSPTDNAKRNFPQAPSLLRKTCTVHFSVKGKLRREKQVPPDWTWCFQHVRYRYLYIVFLKGNSVICLTFSAFCETSRQNLDSMHVYYLLIIYREHSELGCLDPLFLPLCRALISGTSKQRGIKLIWAVAYRTIVGCPSLIRSR